MLESVRTDPQDVFAALAAAPDGKTARSITKLLARESGMAAAALTALKAAKPPLRGRLTALTATLAAERQRTKRCATRCERWRKTAI